MTTGQKIAALRKQKDLSQRELAEVLEVSHQAISKWENEAAVPGADALKKLSKFFEVSMDYFVSAEQQQEESNIDLPEQQQEEAKVDLPEQQQEIATTIEAKSKHKNRSKTALVCLIVICTIVLIACIPIGFIAFTSNQGLQTVQIYCFGDLALPVILFIGFIFIFVILISIIIDLLIKIHKRR